jgi:broad specificity phosphatase PhoE
VPRFLLIRHGESTWNAVGRWQGWADPPLSAVGERQARDAAQHLRGAGLTRVVASDLQRARRTAELLAKALGLGEPLVVSELKERDVGEFSGLTRAEIDERWPGWDHASLAPGAETPEAFLARILQGLDRVVSAVDEDDVVLVATHGGVIRTLERHLGLEPPPRTANLSGRWFSVVDGRLVAGDPAIPLDPDLVTAPPST